MTPLSFEYPISVTILCMAEGGGDAEDTLENVESVRTALSDRGHFVRVVPVDRKNWLKAARSPGQVFFNFVEDSGWKLYTKIGCELEKLGKPQVGLDYKSYGIASCKAKLKKRLDDIGLPTPRFRVIETKNFSATIKGLSFPLIVKPSGEHAGIGISQDSVVIDLTELRGRLRQLHKILPGQAVVEEYIDGQEIHVTVIGNGRRVMPLPFCSLDFGGDYDSNWEIYSYNAKWQKNSWEYWDVRAHAPFTFGRKVDARIDNLVKTAFKKLGCRDVVRFDLRVTSQAKPYILDVNLSPSMNKFDSQDATLASIHSLDWSYEEFIETLVVLAYKRHYGKLPDRLRERHLLLQTGFA